MRCIAWFGCWNGFAMEQCQRQLSCRLRRSEARKVLENEQSLSRSFRISCRAFDNDKLGDEQLALRLSGSPPLNPHLLMSGDD